MPRLGTAMPVRMYGLGGLQQEVPLPQPGAWVKLRNIAACIICGQLQVRSRLRIHIAHIAHVLY